MGNNIQLLRHAKSKALTINDVDPDDGNDWKCDACRLPIFATPLVDLDGHMQGRTQHLRSVVSTGHMHDQCANKIPAKLNEHPLHPMAGLILQDDNDSNTHHECSRCRLKCGSKFYKCGDRNSCGFTLDLLCALPITIAHQSHGHELTATRDSTSCSFICCACGTRHDPPELGEWGLSYVCSPCNFWIHPDCAVLPNAIIEFDDDKAVVHHEHPLLLTYGNSADELWRLLRISIWKMIRSDYKCAICGGGGDYKGMGWYRCFHCDYSVHIKCVMYSHPHPQRFKPVLLRDAKVPGLIHLPMADEHQSVIQRIMNSTIGTINCAISSSSSSYNSKVHRHPLVINQPLLRNNNNNNNDDDDGDDRVCNACVQLISRSDAFYSCNVNNNNNSCRDFFLHSCCAQLPHEITTRRCSRGREDHTLPLRVEAEAVGKFPFLKSAMGRTFHLARRLHNGFAYYCKECDEYIDVINALMPTSITHDAHVKSHILCITYQYRTDLLCICCKKDPQNSEFNSAQIGYECNNCKNFFIHMDCALLPDMVTHDFDRHPLQLITTSNSLREEEEELPLCEICEQDMDDSTGRWFYGCKECDQSFHIDCIPYFDNLSKMKFGFTIRVTGHDCPLACVRALSVDGYKCAHCPLVIRESENSIKSKIAFECADCDYRIHAWPCAYELLLED